MKDFRHLISVAFLCYCGVLNGQQSLTGNIVSGDSGIAIEGAQVVAARREAPSRVRFTPVIRETRTTKDGAFSFKDLPAGTYRICVREAGPFLNPCWWPKYSPTTSAVLDGRQDATLRLALTRGVRVQVRFGGTDESLLAGIRDAASDVNVKVIDSSDSSVAFPLEVSSKSGLQVNYTAVVPNVPTLRLSIGSAKLVLADSTGAELKNAENSFVIPPARKGLGVPGSRVLLDLDPVIVLNVKRRLP